MEQVIETDEAGRLALPPELLPDAAPYTRYVVEARDEGLLLRPEATENAAPKLTSDEWEKQWRELAEEIGKVWPEGVSAADVISEIRR